MIDGKVEIEVPSEKLIKALSFYRPKNCEDSMKCKLLKLSNPWKEFVWRHGILASKFSNYNKAGAIQKKSLLYMKNHENVFND